MADGSSSPPYTPTTPRGGGSGGGSAGGLSAEDAAALMARVSELEQRVATAEAVGRSDKYDAVLGEYGHFDLSLDPRANGYIIGKDHSGLKRIGNTVSANTTLRANGEKQQVFIKCIDGRNGHYGFFRIYGHQEGIEYAKQMLYASEHEARCKIAAGELTPSKIFSHSNKRRSGGGVRENSRHSGSAVGASAPRVSAERRAIMAAQPCHYEARGNCTRGAECWRSHDPAKIAEARRKLGVSE